MSHLAHVGDVLAMHARMFPDKVGARDLEREMTFRIWYNRACRLANALPGIGLSKGDRVCILAYNCVEWMEIYAATAIAGLIAVPINFRLIGPGIPIHRRKLRSQGVHRPGRTAGCSRIRTRRYFRFPPKTLLSLASRRPSRISHL